VARTLDIPLVAGAALTQIGHAIASRGRCLIVLDNAEQVTGPLAEAAAAWTVRAPQARLLVTSRRPLGLPDEQVIAVAPLDPGEAERLFWARAREARPDVATTPGELEAGRALVELLDGLPLAIELAAARAQMLPVSGILTRMKERFRLLAGGAERAPRQATLRATLDWSWNLLSAEEQAVLAQLAVFEGGVPTAALDEVLLSERPASTVVAALVERSLVRRPSADRLHLLMSVAAYDAERLTERGERAATELRHGAWFARLGEPDALRRLEGPGGPARRRSLIAELANLQAASCRAAARGDGPIAARSALAAAEGIQMAGAGPTAVALLRAALATPGIDGSTTAALRIAVGQALRLGGQLDAAEAELERARADAEARQDHRQLAEALLALGTLRRERGRAEPARAALQAAVAEAELAAPLQDTEDLRLATLYQLAIMDRQRGEFAAARTALHDALARSRAASLALQECRVLSELGVLAAEQDRPDEALAHHEASLALARRLGSRADEASRLGLMGTAHMLAGRLDLAATHAEAALAAMRRTGQRRREGISILNLANIYAQSQRRADAQRLYGEALAIARELENRVTEGVILSNMGSLRGEECRYAEAEAHLREALAVQEAIGDRRNGAISLLTIAQVHRELGRMREAREGLETARAGLRAAGVGVFEALATAELGVLAGELGELEEAEVLLREAWEQMVARGNARHGDGVRVRLGLALLAEGKPDEARIELEEVLVQVRRPHGWQDLPRCLGGLARLAAAAGDPGGRSLLDEAVARSGSMPRTLAELRAIRAELLLAAGELDAAYADVQAARESAQPGSVGACVLAVAARTLRERGDVQEAQILHAQARSAYEELGAGPRSPVGRQLAALDPRP
jgi:predicted ATPase